MRLPSIALLLPALASCGPDVTIGRPVALDPTAAILGPDPGLPYVDDEAVTFWGVVSDPNGLSDLVDVSWTSSLDGPLGAQGAATPDATGRTEVDALLSAGTHVVTLTAVDAAGLRASAALTLTVTAGQVVPSASIASPEDFEVAYLGDTVTAVGLVSDRQQAANTLSVRWIARHQTLGTEDLLPGGAPSAEGITTVAWTPTEPGRYALLLQATDAELHRGEDQVVVVVDDPDQIDWDGDGYSAAAGDCDDDNKEVFPGNPEICDGVDTDCNGVVDDKDRDADGVIDAACDRYDGGLPTGDCDDDDRLAFPGNVEACDGRDSDCNGWIDDKDADGDDHVDLACTRHDGPLPADDCDDLDARVNPSADDAPDLDYEDLDCDAIDGDADGSIFLDPSRGDDRNDGLSASGY